MPTSLFRGRKSFTILLALYAMLAVGHALAAGKSVLIIKSSDNAFFNKTVEQFLNSTEQQVKFRILLAEEYAQSPPKTVSDIIVTLGYSAAQQVREVNDIPVVHAYITEFQARNQPMQKNHYLLLLEQPLQRYLNFIRELLGTASVGLIRMDSTRITDAEIQRQEQRTGVRLDQRLFGEDDNPINLVRQILQDNDVLLSLPEPSVYNRTTLKGILLSSYRMNKPVVSYSPAHVQSGALAAIYTSPQQIGQQLAKIIDRLTSGAADKAPQTYYAEQYQISINQRVARSLELKIPSEQEIIQALAKESAR